MCRYITLQVIDNKAGQYCSHYPSELVVIEGHLNHSSSSNDDDDQEPPARSAVTSMYTNHNFLRCLWEGVVLILILGKLLWVHWYTCSRKAQPCTWQVRAVLWLSIKEHLWFFKSCQTYESYFLGVALYHPNNYSLYCVTILLHCVYMFFRVNDAMKVKELISTARFARCRSRFVMPVILYENKVSMEYYCTCTLPSDNILYA